MIPYLLMFAVSVSGSDQPRVISSGCLEVDGDWATAGELANLLPVFRNLPADFKAVSAPSPGARRMLSSADFRAGFEDLPRGTCIERRQRAVAESAFDGAIRLALGAGSGASGSGLQFAIESYDRRPLPAGRLEFLREKLPILLRPGEPVSARTLFWPGRLIYSTDRSVPTWVRLSVWVDQPTCILTRDLPGGAPIRAGDCRFEERRYPPGTEAISSVSQLDGKTTLRPLHAGAAVLATSVAPKPGVVGGQMARLRVVAGSTRLQLEVRVTGPAPVGQSVVITSPFNGHQLRAKVIEEGSLEVRIP